MASTASSGGVLKVLDNIISSDARWLAHPILGRLLTVCKSSKRNTYWSGLSCPLANSLLMMMGSCMTLEARLTSAFVMFLLDDGVTLYSAISTECCFFAVYIAPPHVHLAPQIMHKKSHDSRIIC